MLRAMLFLMLSELILTSTITAQVDSVEQKILLLEGADRTEYIFQSMHVLSTYDGKKAVEYGREVMGNWHHLDVSQKEKYDFYYKLGSSYNSINQSDSVSTILNELNAPNDNDPFRLGIISLFESSKAFSVGDFDKTLEFNKKAYQYFVEGDDPYYQARAGFAVASVSFNVGQYEEGIEWADKVLEILETVEAPTLRASTLNTKGALLREMGNIEEGRSYYYQSLEIHERLGFKAGIARTSNQIAIMEAGQGNYDMAYDLFKKAMNLYEELGITSSYIQMVNNLGVVHRIKGEYDSAITYFRKVVSVSEEQGDNANMALALSNIGVSLMDLDRHSESFDPLEKALELYRQTGSKPSIARVLNNIGNAYHSMKEYDLAIQYYQESLIIKEEIGRKTSIAITLHNIGDLYRNKNDFESATKYYLRALSLKKELGDKVGLGTSYFGLGKVYRGAGQPSDKVLQYVDSARYFARETGSMFLIRDINEFLSGYYAELGRFEEAYEEQVAYKEAYDSLFTTESESVIAEIQAEFKTKEQQQQIELLEQKRRNQNLLLTGLTVGALLLIILIGVVYNRYRLKSKSSKIIQEKSIELEQSNKELKELSEFKQGMTNMIAHDIKNPLNSIIVLSQKLKDKSGKEISKAGGAILQLITNMLDVEKFEDTKPSLKLESVPVLELIQEASLSVELLLHDKSIKLIDEITHDGKIEVDKDIILRVLVNLLSNAIKFSPPSDSIKISGKSFVLDGKDYIKIGVEDHGPGIPEEDQKHVFQKFYQSEAKKLGFAASTGLGLTFCQMAMEAHDGSISVDSVEGKGSTFWITLELSESQHRSAITNEESILTISKEEQEVLRAYSSKLKKLKVHNVGAIMPILNELDQLELKSSWSSELRSAVKYANKERYITLVSMIEK